MIREGGYGRVSHTMRYTPQWGIPYFVTGSGTTLYVVCSTGTHGYRDRTGRTSPDRVCLVSQDTPWGIPYIPLHNPVKIREGKGQAPGVHPPVCREMARPGCYLHPASGIIPPRFFT